MSRILTPVRIGRFVAPNRLVMAPQFDYHALLRPRFEGAYLIGSGLTQDSAESALAEGKADAAVFGGAFLANPDLPERFRVGAPLNTPDRTTFFAPPTAKGYIDCPALELAEPA